jgi:Ca2+-binding EF-hand superfamily protein
MARKLILLAAFVTACGATAADEPKRPAGKLDRGKLFARLDADGDGKLTKDEFRKGMEAVRDRLKEKAKGGRFGDGIGDKLFEKMDANGDGVVTKEEFEKAEFPAAGRLKGKK